MCRDNAPGKRRCHSLHRRCRRIDGTKSIFRRCRSALMAQPVLFKPFRVRNLTLPNRIVIAPMCQYSADDGCMNDWHHIHLGQLAMSGAALLTLEATAVSPE